MSGFVDIHSHGGGGHDFGGTVEGALAAIAAHRAHGTERIVASLVSMPVDGVARAAAVIGEAMREDDALAGIHLEGPFLARGRKGAHDPAVLALPTPDRVAGLLDACAGLLRQITIAPELPGAHEAIRTLADAGVVVAVGHTDCTADQAREAFDAGATLVTHGFNAMRPVTGREPGPLGAALADPRVAIEVIADGIHVDPRNIAMLFAAAPGRIVLVTDAMSASGAPAGRYLLGGLEVDVTPDGRAVLAGTDTLAGSTLTLDRAVEVCVAAGVSRSAAVAAASSIPAAVIGL